MFALLRNTARTFVPRFLDEFSERINWETVRGLHLSMDSYWMYHYRLRYSKDRYDWLFSNYICEKIKRDEFQSARDFFKDFGPPDWEDHCKYLGYQKNSLPIVFRVVFREEENLQESKELPAFFENYPIIYEHRPKCTGLAQNIQATDSVGKLNPATAGTAGGFLRDVNNNSYYLLSCAHVLGKRNEEVFLPGPFDSSRNNRIGEVKHSVMPAPNNSGGCNSRSHSNPDSLDISLAELDQGVYPHISYSTFGKPNHVSQIYQMKTGDAVSLFGKKSGRVDAELGSLCIFHAVEIDNQERCFGDIFTITYPKPWYLNTDLVKEGDSGSWILSSDNGRSSWNGLLFAGDGATGYACFAENIMSELKKFSIGIGLIP